jgi:hypothetical protein
MWMVMILQLAKLEVGVKFPMVLQLAQGLLYLDKVQHLAQPNQVALKAQNMGRMGDRHLLPPQ